jgi:hypothetical protein
MRQRSILINACTSPIGDSYWVTGGVGVYSPTVHTAVSMDHLCRPQWTAGEEWIGRLRARH